MTMFNKKPEKKITNNWRLTIFGDEIKTPPDLLPLNHPDSPHFARYQEEKKKQNGNKK